MNSTKKIILLIAIFLGLSLHSFSQSSDQKSKTDKFGGIGVSVDIDSSVMLPYIVDILSAKPGAMAGLRSGDHIISINGWQTKGKSQEQVAGRLRGRVGTEVKLIINRNGKDQDFVMKREHIEVNGKAGNFCEALDTILKSIADSFLLIKGKRVSIPDSSASKFWSSKIQIPGFDSTYILNIYNIDTGQSHLGIDGDFFIGGDSLEALYKYNKLVADIRDCFPYTINKSYNEKSDTIFFKMITETQWKVTDTKSIKYKSIIGSTITVRFNSFHNPYFEVLFSCQIPNPK